MRAWSVTVESSLVVYRTRRIMVEPLAGFRWTSIFEDYPFRYDPHPKFNLGAWSDWDPSFGIRISYSSWTRDRCRSSYRFFMEVTRTSTDFDNPEYGPGYSLELIFGFRWDWAVIN